ncbi:MAG TPA: ABC transporter permease [Nonomuraea sp.]|uniref:ABC transporter permease n=1 Tax=Nonomuraea sp. NPDC049649 TaxID=3155776 RepID=UPI002C934E57|nr:ABC transporter permease [Nonomuraea sp.]
MSQVKAADVTTAPHGDGHGEPGQRWTAQRVGALLVRNSLVIGIAVLLIVFTSADSTFLTVDVLKNIALQSTVLAVVAVTSTLLVISGEVDLSVGSLEAVSAVTAGYLMAASGWGATTAVLVGLAAGAAAGAVNGFLVTVVGINSIVVTLGMGNIARGLTYLITTAPVFGFTEGFLLLGNGTFLGIAIPIWIAVLVFALGGAFLVLTPTGRHIYAVGMNREAAYLAGLNLRRIRFVLFTLNGLAAGLAGVILASRLNSAPPGTLGVGFELQVLTAVLLGGVAFTGGRGRLFGVLLAVLFLNILQAGLTMMNVANAWQQISQGVALIASVGLDLFNHRRGRRALLPWGRLRLTRNTTSGDQEVSR